jgi:ubiquinone/menaquinone biosynthesis C-methylase UbiE
MTDTLSDLKTNLDEIDKLNDEFWMNSLDDRKRKELEFHDLDRDSSRMEESQANDTFEQFYGNKKYYKITKRSYGFVDDWIEKNAKGKVFLDYACGNGENAIKASHAGASLSLGLDISSVSVNNAKKIAESQDCKDIRFFQADAENTKLPDNSVDAIVCSGMLHHLDLSFAFPELRRILKPGGKILAIEALDYNPIIKFYRYITPDMRTEWEKAHILSLKDVNFAARFFKVNRKDYWHVVGYAAGKFPFLSMPLELLDRLLEKTPLVQLMSWIFTFELEKEDT